MGACRQSCCYTGPVTIFFAEKEITTKKGGKGDVGEQMGKERGRKG